MMRRLLLALLLVALPALPAHAAIAWVQTIGCDTGGTAACTSAAITTTTGNLLITSTSFCCASFTSITDSKSNTYTNAVPNQSEGASGFIRQDYKVSATGGASHTFTLTGSASGFYGTLSVLEISGAAASPLDKTASGATSGVTSHTSPSTATTTQANELLVGAGMTDFATAFFTDTGAGWTQRTNIDTDSGHEGLIVGTKIVSATGAYAYTFTTSTTRNAAIAISTWKEATAAAGVRQRCVGCGADAKVIE